MCFIVLEFGVVLKLPPVLYNGALNLITLTTVTVISYLRFHFSEQTDIILFLLAGLVAGLGFGALAEVTKRQLGLGKEGK